MSEENKKYQKPVLNGLGDRKGKLSDEDLKQIGGGTSAPSGCNSGMQKTCLDGLDTLSTCMAGHYATYGWDFYAHKCNLGSQRARS